MESLFAGVGERRQETGGTGNYRGGSRKNCQSDFSVINVEKFLINGIRER
ncbi:MAG: hypothetical protein F6K18_33020 [Okeania sp. SIO2C2]|nr:hypothetical protein [Okeania sp. SIO2C2]NEP91240.1 hypothetical protein [Okeania sp. SIO2C2]